MLKPTRSVSAPLILWLAIAVGLGALLAVYLASFKIDNLSSKRETGALSSKSNETDEADGFHNKSDPENKNKGEKAGEDSFPILDSSVLPQNSEFNSSTQLKWEGSCEGSKSGVSFEDLIEKETNWKDLPLLPEDERIVKFNVRYPIQGSVDSEESLSVKRESGSPAIYLATFATGPDLQSWKEGSSPNSLATRTENVDLNWVRKHLEKQGAYSQRQMESRRFLLLEKSVLDSNGQIQTVQASFRGKRAESYTRPGLACTKIPREGETPWAVCLCQ